MRGNQRFVETSRVAQVCTVGDEGDGTHRPIGGRRGHPAGLIRPGEQFPPPGEQQLRRARRRQECGTAGRRNIRRAPAPASSRDCRAIRGPVQPEAEAPMPAMHGACATFGEVDRRVPHQRAIAEQPHIRPGVCWLKVASRSASISASDRSAVPGGMSRRAAASSEPSRSALAGDDFAERPAAEVVRHHRCVIPRPAVSQSPVVPPRRRGPWRYHPDISAKHRASRPPPPAPAPSGSDRSAPAPSRSSRRRRAA